jgi:hypothetical protein
MSSADRIFLVPCACSARVPVTAGQAGETMVCPECGQSLDIPRLRDLVGFAAAKPPSSSATHGGWDAARGLMVAGVSIAILGTILATSLVRIGGMFFQQPASAEAIRVAVRSVPVGDLHAAWKTVVATGVRRPPSAEELRLQQFAKTSSGIETVAWGLAGIGLAIAVAGRIMLKR